MKKGKEDNKKVRSQQEAIRRRLRRVLGRICAAIFIVVDDERKLLWIDESPDFCSFLRRFGEEHFGDRFDTEAEWEQSLCEYLTDAACLFLTRRELERVDLSTPRLLVEWFAYFGETMLPEKDILWSSR